MEKILWAPVHRVQIPMHELPTLLYSNHKCLTIGFNVQVMSALMPIVLLKVRKPPKTQIMDVKVSSGKKKTWWQVRECVSFTLFVTEFSPSIYLEKSPAEMIEREDRRGNHLIKLRHLCLILRGQLQTREEILSQCASFLKTTASWTSHESAVKRHTTWPYCGGLGIHLLNRCLSLVDNLKLQRPTNHPWHPNVSWFLPCFFLSFLPGIDLDGN